MHKRYFIGLIVLVLLGLALIPLLAQDGDGSSFEGTTPAPEFPADLDWLNVPAPLTLEALQGKIVLFDFWTYGCINCIHMIPTLEKLEEKYPDELVIIGVHSAKFTNEGETDNIRQIVQRYDLKHPVINDRDFVVWQLYSVRAWPTFTIVDPNGKVLAQQGGEIPFDAFDQLIGGMVAYFDGKGEINREPLELALEGADQPGSVLSYPGKVLADTEGNRLFIADSNHHRLIVADLTTYEVLDVIGTGQRGFDDGHFTVATFNKPQGVALKDEMLYVADTNNHAIRAVDLTEETVTTIAGTGRMGTTASLFGLTLSEPLKHNMRSPWDVELGDGDTLYIALAGSHRIGAFKLDSNELIAAVVGSGREALTNGTLADSALAQPSGLYWRDGQLYFADSESSSIRVADFTRDEVRTLSGPAEDSLFDFGDVDGVVGESRLQHALGVVGGPGEQLYIADTYNSRIKMVDLETLETTTLFGLGGEGGFRDGGADVAEFDEPGGLDYADGKLYVADTNNHAIRVIDLESQMVSTIAFPNPEALQIEDRPTVVGGNSALGKQVTLAAQTITAGEIALEFTLELPAGYKINNLIDSVLQVSSDADALQVADADQTTVVDTDTVRVPLLAETGSDTLYADLTLYYCEAEAESLCFIESAVFEVPVQVTTEAAAEAIIPIMHEVILPEF